MEETVSKLSQLKQKISDCIKEKPNATFPHVFMFDEGISFPLYKITIEVADKDYFIDDKGVKWVRADE